MASLIRTTKLIVGLIASDGIPHQDDETDRWSDCLPHQDDETDLAPLLHEPRGRRRVDDPRARGAGHAEGVDHILR